MFASGNPFMQSPLVAQGRERRRLGESRFVLTG